MSLVTELILPLLPRYLILINLSWITISTSKIKKIYLKSNLEIYMNFFFHWHRIRIGDDYGLEIADLRAEDRGTYTCEVDIMGKPIHISHTVSISLSTVLWIISSNRRLTEPNRTQGLSQNTDSSN